MLERHIEEDSLIGREVLVVPGLKPFRHQSLSPLVAGKRRGATAVEISRELIEQQDQG